MLQMMRIPTECCYSSRHRPATASAGRRDLRVGTTIAVGILAAVFWTMGVPIALRAQTAPAIPSSKPDAITDRQPPQFPDAALRSEQHAKAEIQELIRRYCAALESMNASNVQSLFRARVEREYETQFKAMKSLKCILEEKSPEYITLDYSKGAGVGQLKFGMKRVIRMAAGGAPKTDETIVTMVVSRENVQSPWLIDRLR